MLNGQARRLVPAEGFGGGQGWLLTEVDIAQV